MYNEERKMRFLQEYTSAESTRRNVLSAFRNFKQTEFELNSDLAE